MPIRLAILAILATALLAPATADAGSPGNWTQLGQANLDNIDEVALARTADGTLHAIWTIPSSHNGGGGDVLVHDAIASNGTAAAPDNVTTAFAGITSVPDLATMPDGTLRAFFGGIRTTNPNEKNSNMNTATAPTSGSPWTLTPGTAVKGDAAYAGDDGVAILPDGTPLISFGGTGTGAFVHRGLDPNTPNFPLQEQLGGCCGYSPDVAIDTKTGAVFVVWYSNANTKFGVFAQSLDPATGQPSGAPTLMPGSTTIFNGKPESSQQLSRTPIVARAGGGVFVAYPGGYPVTNKVVLWRVANSTSSVVGTSKNNHLVNLAADPEGRLWVFWIDRSSPYGVFARRSNKSATKFGPAIKVGRPPGSDSSYKISGNAQAGALDLIILGGTGNALGQWHTQVLPALALKASPAKINGSKASAVKFTVSDPDPVKGAKVSVAGKSATTNASGHATISLGPTAKKSLAAVATKSGYSKGTTKVKVKH